jgi:2-polyprenyl-6-methoxyphenol hydroxylase-like FAD-dependent oxidoreductase
MVDADVIVVGAGPTGLLLAAELALRSVPVIVLERLAEPDTTIKAGSINVASAEILDRRGLLPAAEEIAARLMASVHDFVGQGSDRATRELVQRMQERTPRFPVAGHFAGMFFRDDLVDQTDPVLAAHTAVATGVLVPQRDLEALLTAYCEQLGVEIRRGVEVVGVQERTDEVLVRTATGELTAGWVVAADGGRSVVRKQLGIDFPGTEPYLVGYQAVADFADPTGLRRGWTWTPRGIYSYGPIPGRILVARFGPQPADRDAPVGLDELQHVVREVTGVDVTLTGLHGRATRWTDNARQATDYRSGRVFLAGDAAHVHSPFSGQGLNLGLGDAVNLGWKLAATVQGWAPPGLLDTYQDERHPIAAWVLDWTRAQVALMRGDVLTQQLRRVVADELLTVPGAMNRMVALTSGILQHHDVADGAPAPVGSIIGDEHLSDGSRLADHAHDGRFLLLDRSADSRFDQPDLVDRIAVVTDPGAAGASQLVRPDGVIVWTDRSGVDLRVSAERWAGATQP